MIAARSGPRTVLLLWALGAAAWNIVGVQRLAAGTQALGPTASLGGAVIIGVLAILLLISARRWHWLAAIAAVVVLLAGGGAVWGAFVSEASGWPSPAWRLAGVALNGMGVVAALAMLWTFRPGKG